MEHQPDTIQELSLNYNSQNFCSKILCIFALACSKVHSLLKVLYQAFLDILSYLNYPDERERVLNFAKEKFWPTVKMLIYETFEINVKKFHRFFLKILRFLAQYKYIEIVFDGTRLFKINI